MIEFDNDFAFLLLIVACLNFVLALGALLCVKPLHNRVTSLINHINELKKLKEKEGGEV